MPEREGALLLPRMRKVGADSSKTEGTPPGGGHFWVIFWTPDVAHTCGVYHAFYGSQRGSTSGAFWVLPSVIRTF